MSAPIETPESEWTVADLARRFGEMPAWRFVMHPPPGDATEEDLDLLDQRSGILCELIEGILVRKTMGSYESLLSVAIVSLLQQFVKPRRLGWVLGEAGMLRLWPGRVRIPDACYISVGQVPGGVFPRHDRVASLYPDLVVEILSDANTTSEMTEKLEDYFRAGTRLAWYIDPKTRTAEVYRSLTDRCLIPSDGILDGDNVLPGFSVALAEIFEVDFV